MTINAQIGFKQDTNIGNPGQALFGVTGTAVEIRNCVNTPDISSWTFGLVDAPPGTVLPAGDFQSGPTPTSTFTPDKPGGYLLKLTVTDSLGNSATDFRVFQVKLASGRYIPPFNAKGAFLNFLGQNRGWAPSMEEWLTLLDMLGNVPTDLHLFTGDFKTQQPTSQPERMGGRELDLSLFPPSIGDKTRVVKVLASLQASAGTATFSLFDAINGVVVTGTTLTRSSPTYAQVASAALTVGTASGNIRSDASGGGFYEARLALTGGAGDDVAVCTNARLRISYL